MQEVSSRSACATLTAGMKPRAWCTIPFSNTPETFPQIVKIALLPLDFGGGRAKKQGMRFKYKIRGSNP